MLTDKPGVPLVLVVEDDDNHAELIQDSFRHDGSGFRMEIVGNLHDARKAIERQPPSIVLSDYRLPDGSGKDLVVMSNGAWPVILMTSHGDEQVAVDSMKAGALDYVVKSPEKFVQMPFLLQRSLREWDLMQKGKETENALKASEEQLRVIFETSDSGIILLNPQAVIAFANRRMAEMLGVTHQELIGTAYLEYLHESEKTVADELMRQLMLGEIKSVATERRYVRRDGSEFWGFLSGRRLENADGSLRALVGVIADITDRKKAEEAHLKLERQLQQSQKLESLGIMSGGIAHDFNNLLQAVLGNLDLALMNLPAHTPVCRYIEQAVKAGKQAAKLSNMMLAYSGKGLFVLKTIDVTALIEQSAPMLAAVVSNTTVFDMDLDHGLPSVMADSGQIQQVIMNLVINAAEAIGGTNGHIRLSTGVREFDQVLLDKSRLEEKLPAGRYVFIEVSDNGCGMDEDTLRKLFDPFFTTKFTGRGLGMSAAQGIIRAHKGGVLVDSSPGSGTTVRVLFPIVDGSLAGQAVGKAADRNPVSILIVDDEEEIRDVCGAMAEELGFTALLAGDGECALRIFREKSSTIDLVVLDQSMPVMDGVAVFNELRRIRPDVRVLLASGYSECQVSERFSGLAFDGFIQKPFSLATFADQIRRILKGQEKA